MRASELIESLTRLMHTHGDQPVVTSRDTDYCEPEYNDDGVSSVFVLEAEDE